MQYHAIVLLFSISKTSRIRSDLVFKMSLIRRKCHQYCINTSITWYITILTAINKAHPHMYLTRLFILHDSFFIFMLKSIYLKYLKSLLNRQKSEPSISNDMWPHVFGSEVRSHFICFLITYLAYIYFSSHFWQLSTYFKYGKVLESTVSWFLIKPNRLQK